MNTLELLNIIDRVYILGQVIGITLCFIKNITLYLYALCLDVDNKFDLSNKMKCLLSGDKQEQANSIIAFNEQLKIMFYYIKMEDD